MSIAGRIIEDVMSQLAVSIAVLIAVWAGSILLALELEGCAKKPISYSESAEESTGMPLAVIAFLIGISCAWMVLCRACLLSKLECTCAKTCKADPTYMGCSINSDSDASVKDRCSIRDRVLTGFSLACAAVAALLGTLATAVEGPLFSWALGGAYKSFKAVQWLLPILPRHLLENRIIGLLPAWLAPISFRMHRWVLLTLAIIAMCLVTGLLITVKLQECRSARQCRDVAPDVEEEDDSEYEFTGH